MTVGGIDTGRITHDPMMHRRVAWKEPVRCATTANGTMATAFDNASVIDGITLATGDRILLKNQTTGESNGIYIVQASGIPLRAYDMDFDDEAVGAFIYVVSGTANGGKTFYCTNTTDPVIDVDAIVFVQFTGSGVSAHSALTGLTTGDDHTQYVENADDLTVNFVIDGGGATITTGVKGDLEFGFTGHIRAARLFADQSGSIVIDLWRDTYANFPPTIADTITASAKPTISVATKSQDTTLTGWTTAFTAGDVLRINVDSVTSITRVTLSLTVDRT